MADTPVRDRAGYIDRAVEAQVRGNETTTAPAPRPSGSVDAALAAAAKKKGAPLTAVERLRIRTQHGQGQ